MQRVQASSTSWRRHAGLPKEGEREQYAALNSTGKMKTILTDTLPMALPHQRSL